MFTCSWDLRLQSAASSSGTSGNSTVTDNNNVPDTFGPVHTTVHTTGSGSRPARGTKTTSTSAATITDRYFDFNGTVDDPDQIVFTNTLQTKTLTITKNFNDSSGLAENTNYNFSVTVTFDNVGGSDIQLEEARNPATGALTTNNVTIPYSKTFTLTKTTPYETITINVPINTDVTIAETGIASGKEPTYSRNSTPAVSPSATYTFNMGTENQDVVISNPGPTKPIILKVQKVWENVQEIPANTSVSFKVERKIGTGSWTAVGGNAKTADSVPYTVTYDSANGKVTFTNSSAKATDVVSSFVISASASAPSVSSPSPTL